MIGCEYLTHLLVVGTIQSVRWWSMATISSYQLHCRRTTEARRSSRRKGRGEEWGERATSDVGAATLCSVYVAY